MADRPAFASLERPRPEPADGVAANGRRRESVWDYPRPPRLEPESRRVEVRCGEQLIASTERALRVCETAGPPVVYLPPDSVADGALLPASGKTLCEFKGTASYYDIVCDAARIERGAWAYRRPTGTYADLAGYVSFYPALLDCRLAGERVQPQPGRFYGGWVTGEIVGPFKGEPGSEGW